eukprot:1003217-Pelagomonas_calceolata.AAC.1
MDVLCVAGRDQQAEQSNHVAESLPALLYDGDSLPYTDSFKYLGMVCDERLNLSTAAEAALRPCIAGTYCVKAFTMSYNGI